MKGIIITSLIIVSCSISSENANSKINEVSLLNRSAEYQQQSVKVLEDLSPCGNSQFPIINCQICKEWSKPKESEIEGIIYKLDTINRFEWNDYFSHINNCGLKGGIVIENDSYEFYLNAGGWMTLNRNENEIILGCRDDSCRDSFYSIKLTDQEIEGDG